MNRSEPCLCRDRVIDGGSDDDSDDDDESAASRSNRPTAPTAWMEKQFCWRICFCCSDRVASYDLSLELV